MVKSCQGVRFVNMFAQTMNLIPPFFLGKDHKVEVHKFINILIRVFRRKGDHKLIKFKKSQPGSKMKQRDPFIGFQSHLFFSFLLRCLMAILKQKQICEIFCLKSKVYG